jgi:hypothetical protein
MPRAKSTEVRVNRSNRFKTFNFFAPVESCEQTST